jgi:hypothetical protein
MPRQLLGPIRVGHGWGLLLWRHHARLLHCPRGFLRWHGCDLRRWRERVGGRQGGGRGGWHRGSVMRRALYIHQRGGEKMMGRWGNWGGGMVD